MTRRGARIALAVAAGASLAACATTRMAGPAPAARSGQGGTMRPYEVGGVWYTPREETGYDKQGLASWYGQEFHHRTTADGEAFDMDAPSAAHKTLPLPCIVEVTNLDNGKRIRVRVNDRGPFVGGRIIDLSRQGAKDLGFYDKGVARVRVRYIGPAPALGGFQTLRFAEARVSPYPSTPTPATRWRPPSAPTSTPPPRGWPAEPRSAMITPPGGVMATAAPAQPSGPPPAPPALPPVAVGPTRIQIGAFADRGNAELAAARVASRGQASIEALNRGGVTLYRVLVSCGTAGAAALRDELAAGGFPGATILGPS